MGLESVRQYAVPINLTQGGKEMGSFFGKSIFFYFIFLSCIAIADEKHDRWTAVEDPDGSIENVIRVINSKFGRSLTQYDFLLQEDRDLAFNHYKRYVQIIDQIPVHGKSIRIWTELNSNRTVQVEVDLDFPHLMSNFMSTLSGHGKTPRQLQAELTPELTTSIARAQVLEYSDDPNFQGITWQDEWNGGRLVRMVKVRGKRGYHHIKISLNRKNVISQEYREFPKIDTGNSDLQIPVQIYPIYEEVEGKGTTLPRVPGLLKHIYRQVPLATSDIYAPLKTRHYFASKLNPELGETELGRAQGYWSPRYLKDEAEKLRASLPLVNNDWTQGVLLQGRYASINIHPDAIKKYGPVEFEFRKSSPLFPNWLESSETGGREDEFILGMAYSGKPLYSLKEAWNRPSRRLPDHDPKTYMNDGFDEIQVYYAIDTLFESLHSRGFLDPEISTRPFNAFLFNPDIAYRDNAYYTDDTINFTTYSPKAGNMARDNSTIWHELGHGIMDRLMGDHIELADTGGLSEGMADLVAAMVIQAVTEGTPFPGSADFRIINKTGFYLTNEVHDDGEAYGGAMKDFMDSTIKKYGSKGLDKFIDIVLEAMRLTCDHPGLTAPEWFKHILFADSLGRPNVREPNELSPLLLAALAGRNFKLDGGPTASFSLVNLNTHQEIAPGAAGSRSYPIPVYLEKSEKARFKLQARVKNSNEYSFRFPVQIQLKYTGGPIQGAIHWDGKEVGSQIYTLNSETDRVTIPLQVSGTCDEVNRTDGSCVDYVHVQVWNQGETDRPVAKKRFYLRIKNLRTNNTDKPLSG